MTYKGLTFGQKNFGKQCRPLRFKKKLYYFNFRFLKNSLRLNKYVYSYFFIVLDYFKNKILNITSVTKPLNSISLTSIINKLTKEHTPQILLQKKEFSTLKVMYHIRTISRVYCGIKFDFYVFIKITLLDV